MQLFEISYAYKFLGGFYLAMAVYHIILFIYHRHRKSLIIYSGGMLMVFFNFTFLHDSEKWFWGFKINVLTDLAANGALLYFISYAILSSSVFKKFIQTFGWFYFAGFIVVTINSQISFYEIPLEIILRGAIYLVIGVSCIIGLIKKIHNFLLIVLATLFLMIMHVFFGADIFNIWNQKFPVARVFFLLIGFISPFIAYSNYMARFLSFTRKNYLLKELDIKEQLSVEKIQAEKIKELDQLKSRFFANISHEFRTPLTLLLSPIEKRIAAAKDQEDRTELNLMHRNASRLLKLVNQLLDLSRLESGSVKLKTSKAELISFVNRIAQAFDSLAESKQISYKLHTDQKEIEIYADAEKLDKIIHNLLSNALKFTPSSGSVNISLITTEPTPNYPDGAVEIQVKDTGVGIAQDQLEKIFDRFYQVDNSQTREYEGTGIGLALVKELAELHHGEISVSSELGNGSCFTLRLPRGLSHLNSDEIIEEPSDLQISSPDMETHESEFTSNIENPNPSTATVLIAEDNKDLRSYIRDHFTKQYTVLEAADGEEALALALDKIPDLIISDLMMPKLDGIQLCKKLKTDEKTSHIPVIILTAKTNSETKIEGLEMGADDYIGKPFDMKELEVRMHNLIDNRKKLQEKYARQMTMMPGEVKVTSTDERFLKKIMEVVETHLADTSFGVELFAQEVAMSHVQLYRKLTALTGHSPNDFIRHIRLQRAAELLKKKAGNVTEVAYQVGFNNLSYFSKCFRETFGVNPKEYAGNERSLTAKK